MRIEDVQAFPLHWPEGWPRTPSHLRSNGNRFGKMVHVNSSVPGSGGWKSKTRITPDTARKSLREELGRLGAKSVTLSTNVPLRQDGEMRADAADRRLDDPGVAVYFMLKGKPMVMAQDAFDNVAANMRSLALAIDALRSLERHGGGKMMERAFAGFTALPAPDGVKPRRPWWIVLNYPVDPDERLDLSVEEVEARYRTLAKRRHPDAEGGSAEAFAELTEAKDDAVRFLGG